MHIWKKNLIKKLETNCNVQTVMEMEVEEDEEIQH